MLNNIINFITLLLNNTSCLILGHEYITIDDYTFCCNCENKYEHFDSDIKE